MHTSRLKCANQDNFFVVQPMWSHRALQSEGPPLSSMIYCHDLKCLILLNRCTHMCYLSHSVSLFPAFLSSHWKFPQSSAVSLVRRKTAYCRRRGCLYRLYLESCLMMTSRWQHQAESSLISGWKGKEGRAGRECRCIYRFPESLEISQSNKCSRFTHSILLCLYFYPIHFFSGEGNGNPLWYSCLETPMDGGAW